MTKYTQKQLRSMIDSKIAKDITNSHSFLDIPEAYEKIGYSSGIYGCNGLLLKGLETGALYVIASRTTALYIFG